MKKSKLFAYVCLVALVSAGMSSCKNDQNAPMQNQQVTTDIALSLPGQVGGFNGARRMPSTTVQTAGATDFATNGMKNITLLPFAPGAAVTTASTRNGDNISLGTIGATQTFSDVTGNRAKVFTGKQVPLGTSAFLFYGESGATGSEFETGALTGSIDADPASITFTLKSIVTNSTDVTNSDAYKGLLDYLNAVANASNGTKAWKAFTAGDNEGLYEMFQTYATAKVLSSFGIEKMMDDLYQSLASSSDAMSSAIRDSITDPRFASVVSEHIQLNSSAPDLTGFPASLNLPDGAVQVAYNSTSGKFETSVTSDFGGMSTTALTSYVYPSSLWYFANSRIMTANTSKESYYTGAKSWADLLDQAYGNTLGSVNTKTRSIAIKDTIEYAVARLDVQIKTKENDYLEDNDPVAASNHVANPVGGYQLTAVLVGGQKHVGFDFTPATYGGGDGTARTIYDRVMSSSIYTSTLAYSAPNSTLVLETPASENEFIAIELINSSDKDFYGADGIVPIGGKFYLVGQLNASLATETGNQVFKQDYTTTARIAIKDLKSAYNTIPDLKAPQLEIGLSVDLSWQAGHTYDLEL